MKRVPGVEEHTISKQTAEAFTGGDKSESGKGATRVRERKRQSGTPRLKTVKGKARDDSNAGKPSDEILLLANKIRASQSTVQDIAVSVCFMA